MGDTVLAFFKRQYSSPMDWIDFASCSTFALVLAIGCSHAMRREWAWEWWACLKATTLFLALVSLGAVMFAVVRRRLLFLHRSIWWALPVILCYSLVLLLLTIRTGELLLAGAFFLFPQVLLAYGHRQKDKSVH